MTSYYFNGYLNGSLLALQDSSYHHQRFTLESLEDLDQSLQGISTKLHVFRGNPTAIFRYLHSHFGINTLSFMCDNEPSWQNCRKVVEGIFMKNVAILIETESHSFSSQL